MHIDVRSDNLCFSGDRVVLVDLNLVARANPLLDVAAWLPSLHSEGGPLPEDILPDEPGARRPHQRILRLEGWAAKHDSLVKTRFEEVPAI